MKKIVFFLLIVISNVALGQSPRSRSYLQSRFKTGDHPTQSDYYNLFASFTNIVDDTNRINVVNDSLSRHRALINSLNTAITNKVDIIVGKGLSANDYTSSEKTKLAGLSSDATTLNGQPASFYATTTGLAAKQNTLVSGTSIRTVGGNSLLGSTDIPFPTNASTLNGQSASFYATASSLASTNSNVSSNTSAISAANTSISTNASNIASNTAAILTKEMALVPTAVKSSSYACSAGDFVPVDLTSSSVTITLPSAPADKSRVGVKVILLPGSNTATIATSGSDVFNKAGGSTTLSISLLNQGFEIQYSSSSGIWYVISDDVTLSSLDVRYATTTTVSGKLTASNNLSDLASISTAKTNLGIDQINNTSDANKPVSTATQTALNAKQATLVSLTNIRTVGGNTLLGTTDIPFPTDATTLNSQAASYYTNATNISSGTLADARLSSNVTLLASAQSITGVKTFSPSVTASSASAKGTLYTPTLIAAANNDVLSALSISPTYTLGSFTGVSSVAISAGGDILPDVTTTRAIGSSTLTWNTIRANTVQAGGTQGLNLASSGSSKVINLSIGSTIMGTIFGTSGNVTFQNGGTFTDNGFRLEVVGATKLNGAFIIKRTTVSDAAYTILLTDYLISYTTLTATRAVTLPASPSAGQRFVIKDEVGNAATNNITIVGTVNGASNPIAINTNYGTYKFYYSGTAWFTE